MNISVVLIFVNLFAAHPIHFLGCRIHQGNLISPPPEPTLWPHNSQLFELWDPTFTSGNCTYDVGFLGVCDFQWYKNVENGHKYYGITASDMFRTALILANSTFYFISDL